MNEYFEHPGPLRKLTVWDKLADHWRFLPDPVRRSIRTFWQAFLGLVIVGLVQGGGVDQLWSWEILEPALIAGAIAVLTFIHTSLDESSRGLDTR